MAISSVIESTAAEAESVTDQLDVLEARQERARWLTSRQAMHYIGIAILVFIAVVGLGFAIASMWFKV